MQKGILILSTYPNERAALKAAKEILESRLAACVNLIPIRSLFWWKEKMEDSKEYLAIFKTTSLKAKKLKETIAKSHSYEVPEIIEITMKSVSNAYLGWMAETVAV